MKPFLFSIFLLLAFIANKNEAFSQQTSPYYFIENKGQWPEEVKYRADIPSGKMFIKNNGLTWLFYDLKTIHHSHSSSPESMPIATRNSSLPTDDVKMHSYSMEYLGSNKINKLLKRVKRKEHFNYFKNGMAVSGVESYEEVINRSLYKGIDLRFYSLNNQLKYDFIVAPTGHTENIKVKYSGVDDIKILGENLIIKTSINEVFEQKPIAYQIIETDTIYIECHYQLINDVVSFVFPRKYNKKLPLIIDPIVVFSTFSGSISDNFGNTATPAENGKLYSGGIVFGPDFPTSVGAYSTSFYGKIDVAIMKFDSTGGSREHATLIGGSDAEIPYSLVIDNENNLLILGTTSSNNFPVLSNAFQRTFAGGTSMNVFSSTNSETTYANGSDFFVTKLSPDGKSLIASTFVGGKENDGVMLFNTPLVKNYGDQFRGEILTDESGYVYVASHTSSPDFPVPNGFQSSFSGGVYDGVVFKLKPDLSNLEWGSFIGGTGEDAAYSIKISSTKEVMLAGGTTSSVFKNPPALPGLHKVNNGSEDGYIAKIRADGSQLLNFTFLGTPLYDQSYFIDIDSEGNVYAFGQTKGPYPITPGVYNIPRSGQFIHKLSPDLSVTLFSTVFGTTSETPSPNISPTAFLVSECGNIYISGWGGIINQYVGSLVGGSTLGLATTSDAFQKQTDGSDFYLMVLNKNAEKLLYATFFGGLGARGREHVDGGTSRFDKRGIIYHTVCAGCAGSRSEQTLIPNFPTTASAWSRTMNSDNCNMAAFKFDLATIDVLFELDTNQVCDLPFVVNIKNLSSGVKEYLWDFGDGSTFSSADPVQHVYPNPGKYTITLTGSNDENCGSANDTHSVILPVSNTNFEFGNGGRICQGEKFTLEARGGNFYEWYPSAGLNDVNSSSPTASPDSTTFYKVRISDVFGCTQVDSILVEVIKKSEIEIESSYQFSCTDAPVFTFNNKITPSSSFLWHFGDGNTSTELAPTHTYEKDSTYEVKLEAFNEFCVDTKTIILKVASTKIPNVITPNGDNINDYFIIQSQEPLKIAIVNRWGKEVFRSDSYTNDWNGNGLPPGTYYYYVEDNKKNSCKGWVQILK